MENAHRYVSILLIISLILLFAFATFWEIKDINRISRSKNICEIDDPSEKEKLYIFYATLPYENGVTWRMLFIPAFVSTLLLYFILNKIGIKINLETILIVFFIIFFVYYFFDGFKSFHFWRVVASKVQPKVIL